MSQSLIVPPYRRVHHPELTPVLFKQKDKSNKLTNDVIRKSTSAQTTIYKQPKRAFSMTRLDQLAKPRQRYLEESLKLRASVTKDNLSSSFYSARPTSSMSLVPKQQQQQQNLNQSKSINSPHQLNNNNNNINNSSFNNNQLNQHNNNSTILLRQRPSASSRRQQRPVSYAGHSLSSNNSTTPLNSNLDSSVQSTLSSQLQDSSYYSSSSNRTHNRPNPNIRAKLVPFNNRNNKIDTNRIQQQQQQLQNALNNSRQNIMVTSIDGSLVSRYDSLNKPTLPKKPSRVKAEAELRKQQKHLQNAAQQDNKLKKLKQQQEQSDFKMKKSITNPELLDESSNNNNLKVVFKRENNNKKIK